MKEVKPKGKGQHRIKKVIQRRFTVKGREDLAQRPKGEANEVEQVDNTAEQTVIDSIDEVKGNVHQVGQKVKAAHQRKRSIIKQRKMTQDCPTIQERSQPIQQDRQAKPSSEAKVLLPPQNQLKATRGTVKERKATFSKQLTNTKSTPSKQSSVLQTSTGRSIPLPAKQTAPTQPGGSRSAIREKVKATVPKEKPPCGRATIKTRQQVERFNEKATAKPGKRATKTMQKRAQQQMKRHSQRKLAQQAQKATRVAATVTRKAVVAIGKAVVAAFSTIAGIVGGGVLLVALCVILLVATVVSSPFGIFFSNEDPAPGAVTIREVVAEVNAEYAAKIEMLQAGSYDSVEMIGAPADWRDVLAVFAVKTAGANDGVDVATLDADRIARLKAVYWDMTEIETRVEVMEHADSESGGWTERILHITITGKAVDEAAAAYGFTLDQRTQLAELQAPENSELWLSLIYGISGTDGQIVSVALSQVGNVGGQPYWSWYGFTSRVEWCACFVSWCANECGYIDAGTIPKFAGCVQGSRWFKSQGQWAEGNIEPMPGMIIFFDWDGEGGQDGVPEHVGIVTKVENGVVYTVEGNSGDACRENHYPVGYYEIYGYGIPNY